MVATTNAQNPRKKMKIVSLVRNSDACVEAPTVIPRMMVTISVMALLAVLAKRVVTPLSRRRFPKNSMPSRGSPDGTKKHVRMSPKMGNKIFSFCETLRAGFMRMSRSFLVVSNRMIGG